MTRAREVGGAETFLTKTYDLNGIPYLPHYQNDTFVSPAYSAWGGHYDEDGQKVFITDDRYQFKEHELIKAGAVMVKRLLWSRVKFKQIF